MSDEPHIEVGVDVEAVERFADVTSSARLFTETELVGPDGGPAEAARLAGTWCAKEATVKALWPWVHLEPRRVEVSRDPDGKPSVSVLRWDAGAQGVRVSVSITHTATIATAVAVAWGPPPRGTDAVGQEEGSS